MLLPKQIRSLLNGGGAAVGPEGLTEAIQAIETELAAHRRELDQIPRKRADAALADDGPKAIAALRVREDALYAALEVGEIQITKLREKLREQNDLRRRDRIQHHFQQTRAAANEIETAVAAAIAANKKAIAVYEAAALELGGNDAQRLLPTVVYRGMLNAEGLEDWRRYIRLSLHMAPILSAPPGPSRVQVQSKGGSLSGPVRLELMNPGVAPGDAASNYKDSHRMVRLGEASALPPQKPQRELYNDMAGDGEQRVKILRQGYETPDRRQCRNGDIVALPIDYARKVVEHGAGIFAEGREP